MLRIGNQIISDDIINKRFSCDLKNCRGICCVRGDSGAPLEEDEIPIIEKYFPLIRTYLRREGLDAIENLGKYYTDPDGDIVTTLIEGKECAYSYVEEGITRCAIEKAWFEKKITFRKPLSCHLYPIRVNKFNDYETLNYDQWEICNSGRMLGEQINMPVYKFLKEPLIRKYGENWYKKLLSASVSISES